MRTTEEIGKITARAAGQDLQIDIFGPLAWSDDGEGITSAAVRQALKAAAGAKKIQVTINSGGGSAWTGIAIYNLLRAAAKPVHVTVEGLAASAAAIVALAGDHIAMRSESFLMVHEASAVALGRADAMTRASEDLVRINDMMATIVARRSGKPIEQAHEWLRAETWFSASEAVEAGLADEVVAERARIAASCGVEAYKRPPAQLRAALAAAWDEAVGVERRKGVDMATAAAMASKRHPGLREALVAAYNICTAPPAVATPAHAEWKRLIGEHVARGTPPFRAAALVDHQNPGLRQRMLDEANAR